MPPKKKPQQQQQQKQDADPALPSDARSPEELIKLLAKSQKEPLSILRILKESQQRDGADSTQSSAILEAELTSYKEYFSKLRFQYLEQVTKERFLNAITADVPELVEPEEIELLEVKVAKQKEGLRDCKNKVNSLHADISKLGKKVCDEYAAIKTTAEKLSALPASIAALEAEVASLLHFSPETTDPSVDIDLHLPLRETLHRLQATDSEIIQLQRQIDAANRSVASKNRRIEVLDRELKPLEANAEAVSANAEESRRRREEERQRGLANRENVGKWYRTVEGVLGELA
ncbi:hypothetical protein H072_9598 [Dactylellina haptotyla CBS 200.50]|uniref:Kinetochore protein Sos7 coiled-coil domain-containing protein n=1 Tax=Dactylellina haptotyla (strain CBS 200.50) TaxID=1284197 RepID=S8A277_DACHA|nr:hypothetical protein H072_9598 [Dactylellina haptotyla CBS 200.50]